jgi:hypothetical protein
MHCTTLHRRLLDAGTSFRRELDKARMDVSHQLLQYKLAGVEHRNRSGIRGFQWVYPGFPEVVRYLPFFVAKFGCNLIFADS